MMEYLIRNKNSLVSTEKLMDAIWSFDSEAEINVVWAYISALRKNLLKSVLNIPSKPSVVSAIN
jgi:DNA-binding response OmpR family regulator